MNTLNILEVLSQGQNTLKSQTESDDMDQTADSKILAPKKTNDVGFIMDTIGHFLSAHKNTRDGPSKITKKKKKRTAPGLKFALHDLDIVCSGAADSSSSSEDEANTSGLAILNNIFTDKELTNSVQMLNMNEDEKH